MTALVNMEVVLNNLERADPNLALDWICYPGMYSFQVT